MFELTKTFPEFARKAIKASGNAKDNRNQTNLLSFIKTQLKSRSLEPIQGNSLDAILSRAEFRLEKGDLESCLEELKALDDVAKDSMAEWMSKALNRLETVNSYGELLSSFDE